MRKLDLFIATVSAISVGLSAVNETTISLFVPSQRKGKTRRHKDRDATGTVASQWVLSQDFGISNDGKPWTIGYKAGLPNPSNFTHLPLAVRRNGMRDVVAYAPAGTLMLPSVLMNLGGDSMWNQNYMPFGQVVLSPGPNGEQAAVRFTAPSTGHYSFRYHFAPLSHGTKGTTSEAIIVVKNLAHDQHEINRNQHWMDTLDLDLFAGESVNFVVTHGRDGYEDDATGLSLEVERR